MGAFTVTVDYESRRWPVCLNSLKAFHFPPAWLVKSGCRLMLVFHVVTLTDKHLQDFFQVYSSLENLCLALFGSSGIP